MNPTETEQVVARVLSGEIDGYETLVRAYQSEVRKVVAAMLFNTQRTEDLVQQTFINAYRSLHRYQAGRDFGLWLKEIARNQARQELRRSFREDLRLETYRLHLLQSYEEACVSSAQEDLEQALQDCTQKLPTASAKMIELRYHSGRSFQELAAMLGRTVEATRQHLNRVRLALRECINERRAHL
jgi:RNA polymerase sigma-70 factor (ECF subfamily)